MLLVETLVLELVEVLSEVGFLRSQHFCHGQQSLSPGRARTPDPHRNMQEPPFPLQPGNTHPQLEACIDYDYGHLLGIPARNCVLAVTMTTRPKIMSNTGAFIVLL